eukprot:2285736-Pyramimonas_sp.AAC.1
MAPGPMSVGVTGTVRGITTNVVHLVRKKATSTPHAILLARVPALTSTKKPQARPYGQTQRRRKWRLSDVDSTSGRRSLSHVGSTSGGAGGARGGETTEVAQPSQILLASMRSQRTTQCRVTGTSIICTNADAPEWPMFLRSAN